jgi:uncharacterized protein (DUF885 family)
LALPAFLGCWVANAAGIAAKSKRANDIRQFHDVVLTNGALPPEPLLAFWELG